MWSVGSHIKEKKHRLNIVFKKILENCRQEKPEVDKIK
jgi:hypothetical protein